MPPPIDLTALVAHGLDPALFCIDRLGFEPDPWQSRLLRSGASQCILNCGRQVGKSTVVAALALHTCLYKPGTLVLVIAPSQRQSRELFIKLTSKSAGSAMSHFITVTSLVVSVLCDPVD